jgi:hypothetical protein
MKPLFLLPFLFILFFNPAYAQVLPDEIEELGQALDPESGSDLGIKDFIGGIFDDISSFGEAQTNSSGLDPQKIDEINKVNEIAIETGKTSIDLWWNFHELIVNSVFAGSPVPFDRGIIVLISLVITSIVVAKLFWEFFKKTWKIALALIVFITIIWIAGIEYITV